MKNAYIKNKQEHKETARKEDIEKKKKAHTREARKQNSEEKRTSGSSNKMKKTPSMQHKKARAGDKEPETKCLGLRFHSNSATINAHDKPSR